MRLSALSLSLSLSRARVLRVACLVVSFLLEPASWVSAEVESSRLVVDEDGEHEGNGRQPPDESANKIKVREYIGTVVSTNKSLIVQKG